MKELKDQLTLLGGKTTYRQDYAPEVLEAFDNRHPERDYWVRFKHPRREDGGEQEPEAVPVQLP